MDKFFDLRRTTINCIFTGIGREDTFWRQGGNMSKGKEAGKHPVYSRHYVVFRLKRVT